MAIAFRHFVKLVERPTVHHIAFRTHDLEPLRAFYVDVLGLHEQDRKTAENGSLRSIWLDLGSAVLMLERAEPNEVVRFENVLDLVAFPLATTLEAARARLAEAHVAVEASTSFTLYVRDPDGRRIGLSTYRFDREA